MSTRSSKPDTRLRPKLLVLDVDGVLTDGSLTYDSDGRELKTFSVRDGFGLRLWREAGGEVAIITGRGGPATRTRLAELGITRVIEGAKSKLPALDQVLADTGIAAEHVAYMGDDWPDLGPMRRVGYPIAPADAEQRVRDVASFVTKAPGGRGAVREAVEHLLTRAGLIGSAAARYDPPA